MWFASHAFHTDGLKHSKSNTTINCTQDQFTFKSLRIVLLHVINVITFSFIQLRQNNIIKVCVYILYFSEMRKRAPPPQDPLQNSEQSERTNHLSSIRGHSSLPPPVSMTQPVNDSPRTIHISHFTDSTLHVNQERSSETDLASIVHVRTYTGNCQLTS